MKYLKKSKKFGGAGVLVLRVGVHWARKDTGRSPQILIFDSQSEIICVLDVEICNLQKGKGGAWILLHITDV